MAWKKFEIEDGAPISVADFQEIFASIFMSAGGPPRAAIYTQREYARVSTVFVSPDAAKLMGAALDGFRAVECQRPAPDTVSLLVGHDSARDTSFATQL